MNNLKKLGVSALASSLIAVGAQAGTLDVSGAANFTYKTKSDLPGKGIGTNKALTVSGAGELDNGWTFSMFTAFSDALGLTSHATSLTMGSLGTITAGEGWGGNATAFDEEVPQAYEQVSDVHGGGSANSMGSVMGNGGLTWAIPSFDLGGASASLVLGWVPNADGVGVSNGGVGSHITTFGDGLDAGLTISTDLGLKVGAYVMTRENNKTTAAGIDKVRDEFNGTWYATYSAGPVSIGYSTSYLDSGVTGSAEAVSAAKVVRTAAGIFEETQMSIAFNVNDNVSISYTESEDNYNAQDNAATAVADQSMDSEAIQIAYSMGGMSVKAYQMETNNQAYDSNAAKLTATEISIGLAF